MINPNIYIFPQLSDNYGYLIKKPHAKEAIIVDPSDFKMCEKILELNDCNLSHILITHHHSDHISAVDDLKKKFNSVVLGNKRDTKIPTPDIGVNHNDVIEILDNKYKIISTPGHTMEHICYFDIENKILFAGDTLFSLGCGRMFEGTPELFWKSILEIKKLPNETKIYCGHEYTLNNFKFALSIDPKNEDLTEYGKWIKKQCMESRPTMPCELDKELKINPFIRCDDSYFFDLYKTQDPIEVFKRMRQAKDNF